MSAILKSAPGMLLVIRSGGDDAPTAGLITIDGLRGSAQEVIISSMEVAQTVSSQEQQTIGGPNYLYSFGQQLTVIKIGLVAFQKTCDGQSNGIVSAWAFYAKNKLSPTNIKPVSITFGGINIYGFVKALHTWVSASEGYPVTQLTLALVGWIDESSLKAAQSGGEASSADAPSEAAGGLGATSTTGATTATAAAASANAGASAGARRSNAENNRTAGDSARSAYQGMAAQSGGGPTSRVSLVNSSGRKVLQ